MVANVVTKEGLVVEKEVDNLKNYSMAIDDMANIDEVKVVDLVT